MKFIFTSWSILNSSCSMIRFARLCKTLTFENVSFSSLSMRFIWWRIEIIDDLITNVLTSCKVFCLVQCFFFVTSTILRNQLTTQLVDILRFNVNVKIIKKIVNQKNLFFSIQQIHHSSFSNFENLRFLIFVFDINILLIKIIMYEDFINNLVQMEKTLIHFYMKFDATSSQVSKTIWCYNEKMFKTKKFNIYENFMKKNFIIRILCVIDVMKLSINILNVNIIIQWKKSSIMRALMQRVDRVAKKFDHLDKFIWFHLV
jgi:hypothetical protein